MSSDLANVDLSIQAGSEKPPVVKFNDPITGVEHLMLDPSYTVIGHEVQSYVCDDAESFALAVQSRSGDNALVRLTSGGKFIYVDNDLPGAATYRVEFTLKAAVTQPILCCGQAKAFKQDELARWNAQWPGTLVPIGDKPEFVFSEIEHFKITEKSEIEVMQTDTAYHILLKGSEDGGQIHSGMLWTATSPYYDQHSEQSVQLRLDLKVPRYNPDTAKAEGELGFVFSLWSPDQHEVRRLAMVDATQKMEALLGDAYKIVRTRTE